MADANHPRSADNSDLAIDDPFAELTRIMGFDPRQPRKPDEAAAQVSTLPAHDDFNEDDFSIDLEKELMGAFSEEAPPVAARSAFEPWQAPIVDVTPSVVVPNAAEAAVVEAVEPIMESAPLAVAALEAPTTVSTAVDDTPSFEHDWAAESDPEDKAEPAAIEAVDTQSVLPEVVAAESETISVQAEADRALDETAAFEEPVAIVEPVAVAQAPDDDTVIAEMADDFETELTASLAQTDEEAAVSEAVETAEPDLDIDHIFDQAMADIDMRFDAHPDTVAESAADLELDHELDLSVHEEFASVDRPVLHDLAASLDAAPQAVEMSLEEELNALLGNTLGNVEAAMPRYVEPDVAYQAPVAANDRVFAREESHDAEPELDETDLVAVEDDFEIDATAFDWEDSADQPVAIEEDDVPEFVLSDEDLELPAEDEIELDFDEQAFDAAFSHAIASDAPVLHAAEPAGFADALPDDELPEDELHEVERSVSRQGHDPYAALSALGAAMTPTRSWSRETPAAEPRDLAAREPIFARTFGAAPLVSEPISVAPELLAQLDEPSFRPSKPVFAAIPSRVPVANNNYAPNIDTYDVPETTVALADDLDLPDFAYEEQPAQAPSYDDIDAEFTSLLDEMNASEIEQSAPPPRRDHFNQYDTDFASGDGVDTAGPFAGSVYAAAPAAAAAAPIVLAAATKPVQPVAARAVHTPAMDVGDPLVDQEFADMEFAYDPDLDEEMALPAYQPVEQAKGAGRGMLVAAVVGGMALLGGIGAFALSFGGGVGSDEPALVKADATPVKIKPENPGGTTIPNQDNKVYDTVAGGTSDAPTTQEKLVTTTEEPVELPPPVDETADSGSLPGVDDMAVPPSQKAEDRVEQMAEDAGVDNSVEVAAVAPRKVRTMIVKADGTLVAREEPAAPEAVAPASAEPATTASAEIVDPVVPATEQPSMEAVTSMAAADPAIPAPETAMPAAESAMPAAEEIPAEIPAPPGIQSAALAPAIEPDVPVAKPRVQSSNTPKSVPVAPARPSDQPVDIIGEVKGEKVAAAATAAAVPGAWAMQIASQPTEAAAQSSYQDLSRRYGSVLDGRQATIVRAEISGKGTFWRVRIAANTRNEAISLCESYKSAGGNCFVSK